MFLFNTKGIANQFLGLFGFEAVSWFNDPKFALPLAMIMAIWSTVGSQMLIFLAGLQDIPEEVYDAAGLSFFVPATCKNIDGAVRYINWLSTFENRFYLQIGDEGVTHELVDGLPKMITATGEKIMNSANNIDYTFMINGIDVGDESKMAQVIAQSYAVDQQVIVDAYTNAMANSTPPIIVPVTLSAAGPVTQTLIDKGETLMAESITCKPEDFDKTWDAGIQDWLASGAQAVVDERAAKYAE